MHADVNVPAPEPGDSSAIRRALESARHCAASGRARDAIRLIRQAAETAEALGNDLRALVLARAAADLVAELGGARTEDAASGVGLLGDEDNDFADKTIVDRLPKAAAASPAVVPSVSVHETVRVAVARAPDGKLEVTPLTDGEAPPPGADEALLVPLVPGTRFGR